MKKIKEGDKPSEIHLYERFKYFIPIEFSSREEAEE